MSGIFDFTGQDIENTYQRVLQTDGNAIYDGTGSLFVVPVSSIDTSSLATTGSNTFTGNQTVIGNIDVTGSVNVTAGITGSLFGTASYAQTASYVNPLRQTVQITGSLTTTGSNTLIGNTYLTGSLNITGSTIQVGTNTLLGNTTLSGSIIISGSTTNPPTVQVYGNVTHDGYIRFNPVSTNLDSSISASYIYVSGSTNDLYFSQNGSGYNNTTRLRWLEGNLYTGLLHGGIITTQSSTVYQISSGSGVIVNLNASLNTDPYPTIQFLQWPNLSASIASLSASYDQSFVSIDSTANIFAQGNPYTDGEYNTKIPIGVVIHQNRSTINAFQTFPSVGYGWKQRSYDFIKAFGPLKIAGYALSPSGSSTGSLVLSGGTAWVDGRNYIVDPNNPSYIVETTGITTSKIYRYRQSGSGWAYDTNAGAGYPTIDPTQYSLNGALTPVSTNHWTIQRVFYFPNSATKAFYIYYGNAEYANKIDAIAALTTETFNEAPNTAANAIFIGYMILRHNANFTVAASYEFRSVGLFRGSGAGGAGGSGATSLASLTDVSLSSISYGDLLMYDSTYWYNTKTLSGSYTLSGSLTTTGGVSAQTITASIVSASQFTGSLFGTASWAVSASNVASTSNAFIQGGNSFGVTALLGTNDTRDLNFETNGSVRMTISSSGAIGIGTAAPARNLHVSGSDPRIRLQGSSTNIWELFTPTAQNDLAFVSQGTRGAIYLGAFATNNVTWISSVGALTVSSSGNSTLTGTGLVGVGTTSPTTRLTISASGANGVDIGADISDATQSGRLFFSNGTAGQAITLRNSAGNLLFGGSATAGASSGATILFLSSSGNLCIGTTGTPARLHVRGTGSTSATTAFRVENSSGTVSMVVNDTGSVGIGTASPAFRLDVGGDIRFSNANYLRSNLAGGSGTRIHGINASDQEFIGAVDANVTSTVIGTTTPIINIRTNSTSSIYIDSSQRVGIGTTSPSTRLDIQGTTATDGGQLGAELLSTSGWTSVDWTGDYNVGFTHTVGNTSVLSNTLAAVVNNYYQISFTVTGRTAGTFTIDFGGFSSVQNGSNNIGPLATTTGNLTITPTSDFDGTISAISIKQITAGTALINLRNSSGTVTTEIRSVTSNSNTFIGVSSGTRITTGTSNTALGRTALFQNTTGVNNTAVGVNALNLNTFGNSNVAVGVNSLQNNTSGGTNTAVGNSALSANTTGAGNVAIGASAMLSNISGSNNIAIGLSALRNTTTSTQTAVGNAALQANTTGTGNLAIGSSALTANTTANNNTAIGNSTLAANTTGASNTAVGNSALGANISGSSNVAIGASALRNTTTSNQVAVGTNALQNNTTGTSNTAVGTNALNANIDGLNNTAVGGSALIANTSGSNNVAVGQSTLTTNTSGSGNVAVGAGSLNFNVSGSNNVAVGLNALRNTTTGGQTAVGNAALQANTTGTGNLAIGSSALTANTTGTSNVAIGASSLAANTTAGSNVAVGQSTLLNITTGGGNTALGTNAGRFISGGAVNLTNSSNSVFIGNAAYPLADSQTNQIVIGDSAVGIGSNTAVLGNTSIVTTQLRGSVISGNQAALATTATDGFLYIPTCAGIPTGVPTAVTGKAAMVADTTNNKLYVYLGGAWTAMN